jgi:hypothetical protein
MEGGCESDVFGVSSPLSFFLKKSKIVGDFYRFSRTILLDFVANGCAIFESMLTHNLKTLGLPCAPIERMYQAMPHSL